MSMLGAAEPKQGIGMLDLGDRAAFARETLVVSGDVDVPTSLTSATYNPSGAGGGSSKALITHEGANIRWWAAKTDAGTVLTPTFEQGHLHRQGDPVIELESSSEIKNFRVLRVEPGNISTIQVQYFH